MEHKTNLQSHTKTMIHEPQKKSFNIEKYQKSPNYHMEHLYKLLIYTLES